MSLFFPLRLNPQPINPIKIYFTTQIHHDHNLNPPITTMNTTQIYQTPSKFASKSPKAISKTKQNHTKETTKIHQNPQTTPPPTRTKKPTQLEVKEY